METVKLSACQRQCAEDVCMYCGGMAVGFSREPVGPVDAGNFVHHKEGRVALCEASSIYSRARYIQARSEDKREFHDALLAENEREPGDAQRGEKERRIQEEQAAARITMEAERRLKHLVDNLEVVMNRAFRILDKK